MNSIKKGFKARKSHLETNLEQYLKNQIEKHGGLCFKFISGVSGVPDRIIVLNGTTAFIELKQQNKKPTKLQQKIINDINSCGGLVIVVDSKIKIDQLIKNLTNKG